MLLWNESATFASCWGVMSNVLLFYCQCFIACFIACLIHVCLFNSVSLLLLLFFYFCRWFFLQCRLKGQPNHFPRTTEPLKATNLSNSLVEILIHRFKCYKPVLAFILFNGKDLYFKGRKKQTRDPFKCSEEGTPTDFPLCHCWDVLANCFHGNNNFFHGLAVSCSCKAWNTVQSGLSSDPRRPQLMGGRCWGFGGGGGNGTMHSAVYCISVDRICQYLSVLHSWLFLSFHVANCFFLHGREGRKLISWCTTNGHALWKPFALTRICQIKGFSSPCVRWSIFRLGRDKLFHPIHSFNTLSYSYSYHPCILNTFQFTARANLMAMRYHETTDSE